MIWKTFFFNYIQEKVFINPKNMFFINKFLQILLINIVGISLGVFLYQKSSLTKEQVFVYLCLWIIGTIFLFFKKRFIKLLSIPSIIGIWFILVLGFLPLYNEKPDWSNFYFSQQLEYIFIWNPNNVEIKEISEYGEQNIIPTESKQNLFFIESHSRTIIFNETINTKNENNKFVIKLPNNTIYISYPGSKFKIEKINNNYIIDKEYGESEYYQPDKNNQVQIKNTKANEQKNKSDFSLSYMIEEYESQKIKYIINQAWGKIIMQPIYQRFSKNILNIAYILRPKIYSNNLKNYEEYKQLLWWKEITTNYEKEDNWLNLILKQAKKWRQETRFLQ